ncbi:ATP-dependent Clp protease proteolytic subunit [Alteriqipengyuania lutimaris]|uniref:Peptidase S14 n=1 Tax=Alteriqipengyuania lutimaris TaxID=1538146 RepID=A0A395LJU7_9SPHN|nr:ATP-dependent Clp protease proteolytic subunit [Alteriqipengyuania lutimaris]MBB3035117.1 ATP-dependent protease ClpP protease subunit [Alteriqipengyuania lutimaris]RDS75734.1 hypothetical protein DL238_13605 [Alteriqipengyuania lutimaris]
MDFIRNLFTLFQRLQDIVRDGQKRGDLPGMVMSLMREVRGGNGDEDGQGDGPAVYQGKRAQADQATPEAASRATARNKAARHTGLPEPAVYRSPDGGDSLRDIETARAPARNADEMDDRFPQPAAAPLIREQYDYEPASADPDLAAEPAFEPAMAEVGDRDGPAISWDDDEEDVQASEPAPAPVREPVAAQVEAEAEAEPPPPPATRDGGGDPARKDDDWFDLDDWQDTALKVAGVGAAAAGTAAGAMAIRNHFFDGEEERDKEAESRPALPLGGGDEPTAERGDGPDDKVHDDRARDDKEDDGNREWIAAAAVAAPAVASVLPKAPDAVSRDEPEEQERDAAPAGRSVSATDDSPSRPQNRPHPVEIIPGDPRNPSTQPASQSLASPGIRLYGAMDASMYAEFSEMLAEQAPGGPIVIALTTMEGDPDIARSMADDIRLLRDRGRRELIFLGKTAIYGAGALFMAAFPVSHRYLTRATKLMVTENKRAQPLELPGGSLRRVASQLEHARREIEREIEQEDEDYRAISDGSNVSVQELREKAPNDWYITASEAKAMGLIAEVV